MKNECNVHAVVTDESLECISGGAGSGASKTFEMDEIVKVKSAKGTQIGRIVGTRYTTAGRLVYSVAVGHFEADGITFTVDKAPAEYYVEYIYHLN